MLQMAVNVIRASVPRREIRERIKQAGMQEFANRFHGIAEILEAAGNLATARRCRVVVIRTTNLDQNIAALRLNTALGFRRAPGSVEIRKQL